MTRGKKNKKMKQEKYHSEEQKEIFRFVCTLIIVILIILIVYFLTRIFVTKDLLNQENNDTEVTEGTINYNITMIGSMLNKPEDEYYVMIYNTENLRSIYYSGIITMYQQNEDALKVYFANLNNELNRKFYDPENVNLDVRNISDLKVGDLTLLKVRDGQIVETFESEEEIASELEYIENEDTQN